jgi:replicative DNA helicase
MKPQATAPAVVPLRPVRTIELFDLDAEAAVLSAELLASTPEGAEPGALAAARAILTPEDFYSEAHRRIHEACCALQDAGEAIDAVLVASRLREYGRLAQVGGMAYLTQILTAAPAVTHVKNYARVVRRVADSRAVASRLEQAALEIRSGADLADVIARLRGD